MRSALPAESRDACVGAWVPQMHAHARHGAREASTHPAAGRRASAGIPRPGQRWATRAAGWKTSRTPTWTTATTCAAPPPPPRATSAAAARRRPRRRARRGRIRRGCSCPRSDRRPSHDSSHMKCYDYASPPRIRIIWLGRPPAFLIATTHVYVVDRLGFVSVLVRAFGLECFWFCCELV